MPQNRADLHSGQPDEFFCGLPVRTVVVEPQKMELQSLQCHGKPVFFAIAYEDRQKIHRPRSSSSSCPRYMISYVNYSTIQNFYKHFASVNLTVLLVCDTMIVRAGF